MIDFKTPVLAKLKELADNPKHPTLLVQVTEQFQYIHILHKCRDDVDTPYYVLGFSSSREAENSVWVLAAVILGIFDKIVSAAVDATVPPFLKTRVIERLMELNGKKGDDAHPDYAVVETLNICGESVQFRLITWKSAWDLLLDMSPGNGFDVDCRKPDSDPQWEQVASMLGMLGAADQSVPTLNEPQA